jgi:hypothetical protein
MNIRPRQLEFGSKNTNKATTFSIESLQQKNATDTESEVIMLFKVRRSDKKDVDFTPKFGKLT